MNPNPKLKRYAIPAVAVSVVIIAALIYRAQLVAWFTGKEMPAASAQKGAAGHAPASGFIAAGDFQVAVAVDPATPRVGTNTLEITVQDGSGKPVDDLMVKAVAEMPAMGAMPAMRAGAKIEAAGAGHYHGEFELSMAGAWPLTVTITPKDGEAAKLQFSMSTTAAGLQLSSATPASGNPIASTATTAAINNVCPILGNEVKADAKTVDWKGYTIGFCCPPCEDDWNKFTEEKKQAFVDRALKESKSSPNMAKKSDSPPPPAGAIAFHTCSMHPSVKSKDPGTCPICKMDLTPVTHEEVRDGIIFVDARRKQLIGVKTTTAMEQVFDKQIRAVGAIDFDETRLTDVTLKVDGWIGEVFADFTGKSVKQGEPLFTVYAPEMLSVQQDLIDSASSTSRGSRLGQSARERLQLLDLTAGQIDNIVSSGKPLHYVPILSPATGTVIEKMPVKGSSISAGKMVYRIADLSTVWAEISVYESDLPLVAEGQKVTLTLPYLPGKTLEGEVSYIYPYLDAKTRTGRVRVVLPNPEGSLKPDMFVEAKLHVPLGKRLAIPEDAILYAGESNVVFLDLGEGRMRPQKVEIGVRDGDLVEILDGLKAGDTVVSSGNFLVASESKLKSGKDKW